MIRKKQRHLIAAISVVVYALLLGLAYLPTVVGGFDVLDDAGLMILTQPWYSCAVLDNMWIAITSHPIPEDWEIQILIYGGLNAAAIYFVALWGQHLLQRSDKRRERE